MILTNTYQASVEGYMEYLDLDEEQSLKLIKNTVRLAHIAKDKYLSECYEANIKLDEGISKYYESYVAVIILYIRFSFDYCLNWSLWCSFA